jgi:prepilin-type N-terminal cleavage/methylation domain-containing protein
VPWLVPAAPQGRVGENPIPRGFTIIEILVVLGILAILISLTFLATQGLRERAEMTVCMGNLRNLHTSLLNAWTDKNSWPQVPQDMELNSDLENAWWRTNLAPYGMDQKSWTCPTLRRTAKEKDMEEALKENHYVPTLFDEHPATPFRWPNMPWAMEVGNNHGSGLLLIMMDGSIKPYDNTPGRFGF